MRLEKERSINVEDIKINNCDEVMNLANSKQMPSKTQHNKDRRVVLCTIISCICKISYMHNKILKNLKDKIYAFYLKLNLIKIFINS